MTPTFAVARNRRRQPPTKAGNRFSPPEWPGSIWSRGAGVETYTPHGEWLAELLHLAERREFHELILSALGQFLTIRNELASG